MVDLSVTQSQVGTDLLEITDAVYDMVLEVEYRQGKHRRKVNVEDPEQDAAGLNRKDFENNLLTPTPDRYGGSENRALDSGEAKVVDLLADPHENKVSLAGGGGVVRAAHVGN